MATETKIAWTDHTFNIVWGCTKVSPGCAHCYAERLSKRRGDYWGPKAGRLTLSRSTWALPPRWDRKARREGKRARVFCGSMCDVFEDHPTVNHERERLWPLIRATPWLDWLLLTKRPERISECLPDDWDAGYPNVWLGTSVEDQQRANERIPYLLRVRCVVRFLSCEPLLEPIRLDLHVDADDDTHCHWCGGFTGDGHHDCYAPGLGIHWVIVGGESGAGFRPMEPEWADSIRQQCEKAEARNGSPVAFFYKQDAARTQGTIAKPGRWPQDFPPGLIDNAFPHSLFAESNE